MPPASIKIPDEIGRQDLLPTPKLAEDPSDSALKSRVSILRRKVAVRGISVCLTGIDGAGKTTLSRQLTDLLPAVGVPARRLHIFRWYANLLWTPWVLLANKWFGRKVLVFDRSIYDNLAVFFTTRSPRIMLVCLAIIEKCYPPFDYSFYLKASLDETLLRRPDIEREYFQRVSDIYQRIIVRAGHRVVYSDSSTLGEVLNCLAPETPANGQDQWE